ncbi:MULTISPECIES: S9 family peptidase [unclassified Sphingomonas]|uniref:S9 family peptidase n=1 Tax=unclassified Sphingomonas TaxID=196159 RepID=UPI00070239E3|nr:MULTISPECIES: S9 family peptidase [unclassified Sphingomonas]KQN14722.1 peptidase S9 [Sphingomonas sp. Leaf30]MBD8550976.1 S9 family peptidase [Sphingomonas sp. CFBP 8764]
MKILLSASLAVLALASAPATARQLTIDDVVKLSRVSSPAVSKDGRWLVWEQRETDLAADRGRFDLWRLDLTRKGAKPEPLIAEADVNETGAQFSADGATVYYQSDKGGSDAVWSIGIAGGTPRKLTSFEGGFGGFKVAPTGDKLVVWADRKPGAPSLAPAIVKKDPNAGAGRTYDQLFVRHWDTWSNGDRSQLFVLPLTAAGAQGDGVAVTGGLIGDAPSKPFGGGEEVSWSADGRTLYFALREAGRIEATSTNLDIFSVPADGSAAPVNLTAANTGMDNLPTVSPDGRTLAWFAMARAGFEADRQVLMTRDLASGQVRAVTQGWDRSVASIAWSPDSKRIYVTADDTQETPVFAVDPMTGKVTRLTQEGHVGAVVPTPNGVVVAINSLTAPDDFYALAVKGTRMPKPERLTSVNAGKLAGIDMPTVTRFNFKGANDDTVWGYAVKPYGSPASTQNGKVPVAYMVHGGPQGSSNNSWSYRWNPAVFAGAGYGLVAVDFHGSTGYGQAFTDAISNNWGGWPLEDLQKGLAAATAKFGWLDGDRACALGASYGGYMMNWIEGKWPDRFKCIVQHDGVFDARAMAYETEELWFDEWEHGGKTYYEDPAAFEKWNPVNYVANWKTPMLVITGEKDFRIPYTQGLASFTALQRRGIPSRLLVNPNENHWVLKPKNSLQWYGEVIGWMDKWTAK